MSQWDKLLQRVLKLDTDLRFEELKKILENYGYVMKMPKNGSSHCVFRCKGRQPMIIPKTQTSQKSVY